LTVFKTISLGQNSPSNPTPSPNCQAVDSNPNESQCHIFPNGGYRISNTEAGALCIKD